MQRTCKACGAALQGMGSNKAVLCIDCWTTILLRVEAGETRVALANEYGVSRQAVELKWMLYGGNRNDGK